jgi:hypothetical protein
MPPDPKIVVTVIIEDHTTSPKTNTQGSWTSMGTGTDADRHELMREAVHRASKSALNIAGALKRVV